jgi:predicted nucleotide-binding protein (sugar kinase/HSP70/actin superfamily)
MAAGLLVIGAQSVKAQSTNSTSTEQTAPAKHKNRNGALLKALDLTPADLKGLSKEDRQAKMKEAAEKVQTELKAKASLTDEEQKRLDIVTKFLAHANKKPANQ